MVIPCKIGAVFRCAVLAFGGMWANLAYGAKISSLESVDLRTQFFRFLSMEDELVRTVLLGSLFLGLCCGLLGSFIVVRKLSLVGDALSHAVLPGVAIGFIVAGQKDPLAIFVGATVAGLAGTVLVNLIKTTTHIKEDSSLGMVLAGFYGLGIVLITMVQKQSIGNKAGLDKFLFGQVAALSSRDVWVMAVIAAVSLVIIAVFYKQFLVGSFDAGFSRALGIPTQFFHYVLMILLAFAVVVSLQAVGAVLVSAMLIIPASAAYLLTDRMHRMLILSSLFGMGSGALGAFLSFLGPNLPTGPLMVIAASSVFSICFFFSPKHGMISRWAKFRNKRNRVRNENTAKAIYQVRERNEFQGDGVLLDDLAARLHESRAATLRRIHYLVRANYGDVREIDGKTNIFLNPEGWVMACAVVRNHRLWELYLTNEAKFAPDHVHEDAEKIEHMLGEETVRRLERLLDFPSKDPHGKLIPSLTDLQRTLTDSARNNQVSGYRMPDA